MGKGHDGDQRQLDQHAEPGDLPHMRRIGQASPANMPTPESRVSQAPVVTAGAEQRRAEQDDAGEVGATQAQVDLAATGEIADIVALAGHDECAGW